MEQCTNNIDLSTSISYVKWWLILEKLQLSFQISLLVAWKLEEWPSTNI